MKNNLVINRRTFCLGILASGAVEASQPIIDITKTQSPIIDLQNKKKGFADFPQYFDIEPKFNPFIDQPFSPRIYSKSNRETIQLALKNVHTQEEFSLNVPGSLQFSVKELKQFNHFCRDWRRDEETSMDPELLKTLSKICHDFHSINAPINVEILSGFRTESTNEMLRRKSNLVAQNSFHIKGQALDFRLVGVDDDQMKISAKKHAIGGLGIYRNFIHIDTGPRRQWIM
jgi:uncharacterized protein YcbK (DUF882 family)